MKHNKPDIEQLESGNGFTLLETLRYEDIVSFVFRNIRNRNFPAYFYYLYNVLCLAALVLVSVNGFMEGVFSRGEFFSSLSWGIIAGSFLIIPVHEACHALAYKLVEAPSVHFGADLRQMIFYVAANRFVADRKEFTIIALTPFVLINAAGLIFCFVFGSYWPVFMLSMLLFHNIMCIGDFAMLSFFRLHQGQELFTFDIHEEKVSYIYKKSGAS